jgi:two-component system, OmpR family, response regulator MprA
VSKVGRIESLKTVLASLRFGDHDLSAQSQRPLALVAILNARLASFVDRALASAGYAVEQLPDAVRALDGVEPDIVLLDASTDVAEQLRERTEAPILVLCADGSVESRIAALDAGADDVLSVPFDIRELVARVRALSRGRALAAASALARGRQGVLSYADLQLDLDTHEVTRDGRKIELRHKAFELLAYFMRHPQRVLSRRELLEEVWGYEFLGDSNVIEVTVSAIRQALEAGGQSRLIFTVRPVGYILRANGHSYGPNC